MPVVVGSAPTCSCSWAYCTRYTSPCATNQNSCVHSGAQSAPACSLLAPADGMLGLC